jgi:hypothetical protein
MHLLNKVSVRDTKKESRERRRIKEEKGNLKQRL